MKAKCNGVIGFKSKCPKRMECQFYIDMLNNPAEKYTQIPKKKTAKEMQCFKAI